MIQAVGYRIQGFEPDKQIKVYADIPFCTSEWRANSVWVEIHFSNRAFAADRVYLPDCGGAVCAAVVCNGMLVLSMSWVNFQDPSA